jgi:hypothetical protein
VPVLTQTEQPRHQDISGSKKKKKYDYEDKEIFSFRAHNMQYFDSQGVKERTGYGEPKDWYFMVIKELLDNPVDHAQGHYRGYNGIKVTMTITISEDEKTTGYTIINYKVRCTNPENKPIEAFNIEQLNKILDYSMSYGSKQNDYKISRGFLGDATKQIIALPYVLMHREDKDDGSAFFKKQWEIPMYFRANGIERQVLVKVNKAASEAFNQIIESPQRLEHTDTEVEVTLPIIEEVKRYIDIPSLERFCRRYTIFTTDISFEIRLVDERPDTREGQRTKEIVTTAQHAIVKEWNNTSSAWSYRPEEFIARIESVHDRQKTSLYDILRKFKEGAQMPKKEFNKLVGVEDVYKVSIADFMEDPYYQRKAELLYHKLRGEEEEEEE